MQEALERNHFVEAGLNFAANARNGGIWSNHDRSLITQELSSHVVKIHDASALAQMPSFEREGFELHDDPVAKPSPWTDGAWVANVYMPHCADFVQSLVGASRVVPVRSTVLVRDTGNEAAAPAASFVHHDVNDEMASNLLEIAIGAEAARRVRRFQMFNIWRAISPPPQDVPLALCDQRTGSKETWVLGQVIVPDAKEPITYITSLFSSRHEWYYFPRIRENQALIFKNYDSDPSADFGCLHGAFKLPSTAQDTHPRASVEGRVFAIYD